MKTRSYKRKTMMRSTRLRSKTRTRVRKVMRVTPIRIRPTRAEMKNKSTSKRAPRMMMKKRRARKKRMARKKRREKKKRRERKKRRARKKRWKMSKLLTLS